MEDSTKQQLVVVELVLVYSKINKFVGKHSTFSIGGDVFCGNVEIKMRKTQMKTESLTFHSKAFLFKFKAFKIVKKFNLKLELLQNLIL